MHVDTSHQDHMHRQSEIGLSPSETMHLAKSPRSYEKQNRVTRTFSGGSRNKHHTLRKSSIGSIDSLGSTFSSELKSKRSPVNFSSISQMNGLGSTGTLSPRVGELSGKQAMHEFAVRFDIARGLLFKGVPVTVWDRSAPCKQGLIVKLSNELGIHSEVPQLQFTISRSYLVWREPCKPFVLDYKTQAQMGAHRECGGGLDPDDELSVTLIRVSDNSGGSERRLVMRCNDEKSCRDLFSAIRTILTEASLRVSGISTIDIGTTEIAPITTSNITSTASALEPQDQSNSTNKMISQLEAELAEERKKCQQIMLQVMEAANDGNNKEVEINVLRVEIRNLEDDISSVKQVNSTHMNMYSKSVKRMEAYQFECEELHLENAILRQKAAV